MDTEEFQNFWIDGVVRFTFLCVGFIINGISISLLLSKKKLQSMFNHLLACSLITDNCYLFVQAFLLVFYQFDALSIYWLLPYFAFPFQDVFQTANALLTICLSHERYSATKDLQGYTAEMAFKRNRYVRLLKYLALVVSFSIIFCIPRFLVYTMDADGNNKGELVPKTSLGKNEDFRLYYKGVRWISFLSLSFVALIFFNWKTWKNIRKASKVISEFAATTTTTAVSSTTTTVSLTGNAKIRKSMEEKNRKREKKTSFTLFALTIVFFICNGFFLLKQIIAITPIEIGVKFERTSRMLLTLNSCVNVIVYCMTNAEFRKYYLSYLQQIVNLITCKYAFKSKFEGKEETRSIGETTL